MGDIASVSLEGLNNTSLDPSDLAPEEIKGHRSAQRESGRSLKEAVL